MNIALYGTGAKAAATFKCLDSRMLWASVRSFPFDRKLVAQSTELCGYEESPDYKRTDALSAVYDPAFVLPTVYQALLSSDDVDIRKLIESHVVGYCVSSLSSRDVHVRIAGSAVLRHLFDNHFKHSSFREQSQVQYLLSVFRDGIESNDQRVPTIMTVFVSEALLVLIAPDHAMYATVNKFILQRPYLPLDDVPLFYNMLLSGDDTSIAQQNWMLRWVTFGLVDESDWALYKRRHVGELLLSMSESRLSDKTTRQLVSEFFLAAVHIPGVANELFRSAGLVTWLFTRASLSAFDLAPIHRPGVPFDMPTYCRSEAGDEFEDTLQMAVLLWQRIDARSRQWPLVRETYQALLERAFRWINVNSQAMGEGECVNRCTILLVALAHLTDNEDIQPHTHTHTKTSTLSDTHTSTQKTHTHNTVHTRTKDPGGTPARPSALDATTPSPISIKPSVMESFVRTCILFGVVQPHTQSGGERVDYTHAPNMHRLVRVVCVAALDNCPLLSGGGGSSGIRNAEIESVIWLIQFCVSALSVGEDISLNSGRSALTLATNERARSINRMSGSIDFLVESVLGLVARRGAMGRAIRLSLTDIETGPSKMLCRARTNANQWYSFCYDSGLYTELKSELSRLQSGSGASPEAGVVALATAVQLQNLWQKSLGSDDVLCTA
ncbi:hypothetical protein SARC_01854 [Sphaeroforma arctica JP610]|uniref:URB1 C-terminal domain-containing protein n=1 Tax=Sphaeroforma arctica JP610 TaxID=667725 RepID=A0A0L0GCJ1_9EUKA|nr:hypothetical protein SARC_01854 [Sphaeroforma arctica JP610]KNC85978.1 hypothetical protein SARC_01854 [Sphaeroforma arctica JP610]|eukprot:XP_014159880.1 hypothetical protein SARC_01854 [Sphaeroforma arctica JP610]